MYQVCVVALWLLIDETLTVCTGSSGSPGTAGVPGETGGTGQTGFTGQQGPRGSPGQPGDVGATGPQGQIGGPGQAGVAGAPGNPGGMGSAGARGVDGAPGDTGPSGTPGMCSHAEVSAHDVEAKASDLTLYAEQSTSYLYCLPLHSCIICAYRNITIISVLNVIYAKFNSNVICVVD